jgi:hypothetical protein
MGNRVKLLYSEDLSSYTDFSRIIFERQGPEKGPVLILLSLIKLISPFQPMIERQREVFS